MVKTDPKKLLTIGIDPGVNTGFAVYDRNLHKIVLARTVTFWELFRDLLPDYPPSVADIVVEDANLNKPTFKEHGGWEGRKREKISRNVGSVQAESRLIIEGLRLMGYTVLSIKPGGKKWDSQMLERITGYGLRTSQHVRDAIRFCYGVKQVRETANGDV
jgi:hypothetical protein